MEIIVCIKQVIAGDQVRFDPNTHGLIRSRESSRINPFDLSPLAMARELKKEGAGTVTVLTMGPEISEEVLWQAFAAGADRAVLLSDPQFASSDTLTTSYVLGMGIRKIGSFDLILCGMRTSDSGTGQVGPQLAEELDLPHITGVEQIEIKGKLLRVERISDGFRERIESCTPALLTISSKRQTYVPGLVEIEDAFSRNEIERWNLKDLKADPGKVGRAGSRTWVENLIPITHQKSCDFIQGDSRQQARSLVDKLLEKSLLS
jgi:electron transfer flavoprotein beta subunit